MNKAQKLNKNVMRHLLLVLVVVVGAFMFDNFYASLNISWSDQVESLLNKEAQQTPNTNERVLQLCAVSLNNSFKLVQNDTYCWLKRMPMTKMNRSLEDQYVNRYEGHKLALGVDKPNSLAKLHFHHFSYYHQADADDDSLLA